MQQILLSILLVLFATSVTSSTRNVFNKDELTIIEGLPNNDVHDIIQDSYGFVWMATMDGVCRYDGCEFLSFSIGDLGLTSNLTSCLVEDKYGNIWVGTTHDGIYCYLRRENRFLHAGELMDAEEDNILSKNIRRLAVDNQGDIWCYDVLSARLVRLEFNNTSCKIDHFEEYHLPEIKSENLSLLSATNGELYIAIGEDIYSFSYTDNSFIRVDTSFEFQKVHAIERRGNILFVANDKKLITLNLSTGEVCCHHEFLSQIYFCWVNNTIWVTSSEGVYNAKYSPDNNNLTEFKAIGEHEGRHPLVITKDHANGVWIGYRGHGVDRYSFNTTRFRSNEYLDEIKVTSACVTSNEMLMIGSESNGLYSLTNVKAKPQRVESMPYTSTTIVYSISEHQGDLIVATNRNLYRLSGKDYSQCDIILKSGSVRKVLSDGEYLWLAQYRGGLLRFNLKTHESLQLTSSNSELPSDIIRNVMLDSHDNLWMGTSSGLAKIENSDRLSTKPSITPIEQSRVNNNYVISILESREGDIWYGTLGQGVYCVKSGSAEVSTNINKSNGLSSNIIESIEEDSLSNIWLSTNKGLSHILKVDGDFRIKNYNSFDELQKGGFGELSSAKLSDGTLIFGGQNGFNFFNPSEFKVNMSRVIPAISDFKVNGESLYGKSGIGDIISGGVADKRGITLRYNQNNFAIKYVGLHYSNTSKISYRYVLDGVDRSWIATSSDMREVNYSNINSGNYTFYLQASNSDGEWTDEVLKIPITIEYPIWRRWYAVLLYAILMAICGYYIILYIHAYIERRNASRMADMERKKIEELLELRTRFFTNVSHEFRTPLTLILSPLQRLMEDEEIIRKEKNRELLGIMQHNGNTLMRLINEFLNYTKQESGELKAQQVVGDFTALTKQLFAQFKFWADRQDIRLIYNATESVVILNYDPYLMEQIIYNLVSNAIKYTPARGEITMAIEERGESVVFSVSDNGCGIPEEQQSHIFERFYSRASETSKVVGGTGVGLFLTRKLVELHGGKIWFESTLDQGTTFFVEFPVQNINDIERVTSNIKPSQCDVEYVAESEDNDSVISAQNATLLIVDDNIELLQILKDLFEGTYQILLASDGVEAQEVAMRLLPDLIISDVMMPRMDGIELCEKLKGDATTSHIPIILLSAKTSSDDIATGLRATADAYCPKPFDNIVLREMVNSTLANRRLSASRTMKPNNIGDDNAASIADMCTNATTTVDKMFLAKLTKYIEENLTNSELSVTEICDYMGFSPFALNKKLKSLLNMTTIVLVRTIRLRRAAVLLKSSRYSVSEVTYDVGFSDLKYFRRCFKQEFGILPQEYKNQE